MSIFSKIYLLILHSCDFFSSRPHLTSPSMHCSQQVSLSVNASLTALSHLSGKPSVAGTGATHTLGHAACFSWTRVKDFVLSRQAYLKSSWGQRGFARGSTFLTDLQFRHTRPCRQPLRHCCFHVTSNQLTQGSDLWS